MANRGKKWTLLSGAAAAVGAAALYFLDRERGRGRRAAFSRKAGRLTASLAGSASRYAGDVQRRLKGIAREAWNYPPRRPPDDRVLEERIRSRMGRIVAHPHRIHVASERGTVSLWGAAAENEVRKLVHAVETMPGVVEILNHLERLEPAEPVAKESNPLKQAHHETLLHWSPAARLVTGVAGASIAVYGWKSQDRLGVSLSSPGAALAAATTLKRNLHSVLAFSEDSPGFELEETVRINAPISDLYDFWANPENYPKVFSHITAIERLGENLYRWTVTGPAGLPIHSE